MPEAKNIRRLSDEFKPVVVFDMHHQGTRVNNGDMVTASTLYPTALQTATRPLGVDSATDLPQVRPWPRGWSS